MTHNLYNSVILPLNMSSIRFLFTIYLVLTCSTVRNKRRLQCLTITYNSEIFENNGGICIIRINGNYIYTHSLEGGTYPTTYTNKCRHLANMLEEFV